MKDVLITSSALILALLVLRRLFRKTLSRRVLDFSQMEPAYLVQTL